jgi:glycosyltransferase involved in cell wall biosynthesis
MKQLITEYDTRVGTGSAGSRRIHATFFMEQHLGHRVHYQNLRTFVDRSERVDPTWVPVTYTGLNPFIERFPLFPESIRGSLVCRMQVRRRLKAEPSDILYFNTQVPAALGNPLAKDKPYLIATDITPVQYDRLAAPYHHHVNTTRVLRQYKQHVNMMVFQGAARLLPWSTWAAESLVLDYGVDPRRIEVLPAGVDLERWHPARPMRRDRVRILFVGGNFDRKGGFLLLEAFRSLPPGLAELSLVTPSPVPPLPGVTVYPDVLPNSEEMLELYQSSDIFVLPSYAEAFGIAAVEASASGLPVIATFIGGLPDLVIDQKTGFLIPVGDVYALATHLRILVENAELRWRMGQAAYCRAQSLFDARKNAARLVQILCETVSEREN